jgi:hypothetical protein
MSAPDAVRHVPKPLSEVVPPVVAALVDPACADRLVLYLGAGVSIPPPASGPRGNQVADRLRPIVAELLGVSTADLPEENLESLATRVERDAPDRLGELRTRAAEAWAFRDMEPNYGHEMLALLLREGLSQAVSANWDCGVENGGRRVEVAIEGVSRDLDLLHLPNGALPLYKVHGCARRPETLVLTADEVDQPRLWARAKVQNALTAGTVVFLGLGTVGAYVGEPVRGLFELWVGETSSVRVIDPFGLSDTWSKLLEQHADAVSIVMDADDFLDDLGRAIVSRALSRTGEAARDLHGNEQQGWSAAGVSGHGALVAALSDIPADAVLRWWRGGVTNALDGKTFLFDRAGQIALMCVAQLAATDGGNVVAAGSDGTLTVRSSTRYFEIACRPQEHWTTVRQVARARVELRRRAGYYGPGASVTVAIAAATGAFPAISAPADIAGSTSDGPDVADGGSELLQIVRAEDSLDGRLAA